MILIALQNFCISDFFKMEVFKNFLKRCYICRKIQVSKKNVVTANASEDILLQFCLRTGISKFEVTTLQKNLNHYTFNITIKNTNCGYVCVYSVFVSMCIL